MSLAMAYAAKKRGDGVRCAHGSTSCEMCHGGKMAEGGDVVSRIMAKKFSKGGQVANDTEPVADFAPNEFDDLVLRDDLEFSYTGANSGDELGNAHTEDQDRDLVRRIMASRAKKDRNPRPA